MSLVISTGIASVPGSQLGSEPPNFFSSQGWLASRRQTYMVPAPCTLFTNNFSVAFSMSPLCRLGGNTERLKRKYPLTFGLCTTTSGALPFDHSRPRCEYVSSVTGACACATTGASNDAALNAIPIAIRLVNFMVYLLNVESGRAFGAFIS